ncbi:MAG: Rne/Rng family ribonuclease [Clostridia bacterium]|jgi:ribonuclease G|nr:Rne/Rng family ribonuclease [Clostridia bacterium]
MIELIINKTENTKIVAAIENGKLVEVYEENEESQKARKEGNIYIGEVQNIIPGMQAAFIDIGTEKNSFIHVKDIVPQVDETIEEKQELKIKDVVKPNQKLIVQVQKDSNNKKGARTSTHIKLTGKYVILMPNTNIVTISKKIEDEREKERLLKIVKERLPQNTGAIIRTAAKDNNDEKIIKDLEQLDKKWKKILKEAKNIKEKAKLLYQSPSILEKIILDMPEDKITRILVNDKQEFNNIKENLEIMEEDKIRLELEEKEDLLGKYEIEKQIEKSKQRKVWLNCGGFITIDPTEALVAIDVNSGKFIGKSTLEETIYKVNYEATIEIVKQLRLRDIGGIVIIDYIDMNKEENKEKIENLLKEKLKEDRAKTQVEGFTKLNLMELTRKHICSHNN